MLIKFMTRYMDSDEHIDLFFSVLILMSTDIHEWIQIEIQVHISYVLGEYISLA